MIRMTTYCVESAGRFEYRKIYSLSICFSPNTYIYYAPDMNKCTGTCGAGPR